MDISSSLGVLDQGQGWRGARSATKYTVTDWSIRGLPPGHSNKEVILGLLNAEDANQPLDVASRLMSDRDRPVVAGPLVDLPVHLDRGIPGGSLDIAHQEFSHKVADSTCEPATREGGHKAVAQPVVRQVSVPSGITRHSPVMPTKGEAVLKVFEIAQAVASIWKQRGRKRCLGSFHSGNRLGRDNSASV